MLQSSRALWRVLEHAPELRTELATHGRALADAMAQGHRARQRAALLALERWVEQRAGVLSQALRRAL